MNDVVYVVECWKNHDFLVSNMTVNSAPDNPEFLIVKGEMLVMGRIEANPWVSDCQAESINIRVATRSETDRYYEAIETKRVDQLFASVGAISTKLIDQAIPKELKDLIVAAPGLAKKLHERINVEVDTLVKAWNDPK